MRAKSLTRGLVVALAASAAALMTAATPAHAAGPISGTLALTAGACSGSGASGTYFRMINPTGTRSGPFLENGDSPCADKKYTLLAPGTDGGLILGTYQSEASPKFDGSGNSLSKRLIKPVGFFGVNFSASTNALDPQTGGRTVAPSLTADAAGKVSGDLRAFAASWNKQEFNQGAPKPDGSKPGITSPVTGTYNASTGAITIEWTSQIVGGPFDKFTGLWHLTGVVRGAGATSAPVTAPTTTASPIAAPVASTTTTTPTPTASASTEPTAAASLAPSAAPVEVDPGAPATTTETASVTKTGARAPGWLILVVAALGIFAVGIYFATDRLIKARA